MGKDDIPNDENSEHRQYRREKRFPTGVKMDPLVEAKDERGQEGNTH
jgi:hypothetical protein